MSMLETSNKRRTQPETISVACDLYAWTGGNAAVQHVV